MQSRYLKLTAILFASLSILITPMGVSFAQATQSFGDCTIPKEAPLTLSGAAGETITVTCIDGEILTNVSGSAMDVTANATLVEAGPAAIWGHTCHIRSTTYDNSAANIVMTWFDLAHYVQYDGTNIRGSSYPTYSYYARGLTGWTFDYGSAFVYNEPLPGPQKGSEGWGGFSGVGGAYAHEHHVIMTNTGAGGCFFTEQFEGTLPNFAYYSVYSYTS